MHGKHLSPTGRERLGVQAVLPWITLERLVSLEPRACRRNQEQKATLKARHLKEMPCRSLLVSDYSYGDHVTTLTPVGQCTLNHGLFKMLPHKTTLNIQAQGTFQCNELN